MSYPLPEPVLAYAVSLDAWGPAKDNASLTTMHDTRGRKS